MVKFLFWNLNNRPIEDMIARLAETENIDVFMFAECALEPNTLLNALNADHKGKYHYAPCRGCKKIKIFLSFSDSHLPTVLETDRLTVRQLTLPDRPTILLAVVHMLSKVQYSKESQEEESRELAISIREAEAIVEHSRTVLCGDFNMNPFEYGVAGAGTLNAVMTKEIASRLERTIQGRSYRFFYNPMWAHFGDSNGTPPGTHYYAKSDHLCYYWNMFDQVLLRPELLDLWHNDKLRILKDGNGNRLSLGDAVVQREKSDHLPITDCFRNRTLRRKLMIAGSLWPAEINPGAVTTPKSILDKQASILGEITNNVLEGEVRSDTDESPGPVNDVIRELSDMDMSTIKRQVSKSSDPVFYHSFFIKVPSLNNYRYKLFYVYHPITLFPTTIVVNGTSYKCADEAQFTEKLRVVLSSKQTTEILAALINQGRN